MKTDLPQFTGLRGIAALLVLFFHIRTPIGTELTFGIADPFSMYGFLGVDIFFVISGFVLSHVYTETFSEKFSSADLVLFAVARFSRIYPLHIVTTLLMLLAYAIAARVGVTPTEISGYSVSSTVVSLLLVQEWLGVVGPNPGSWSISIELINYLAFPFIIFFTSKLPKHWPLLVMMMCYYVAEAYPTTNIIHCSAEFLMGASAHAASTRYKFNLPLPLSGMFLAIPFLVNYNSYMHGYGFTGLCFAAAIYFLTNNNDQFARFCSIRPLVFVGDISYSIYLLQWFVWVGWKHVLAKVPFLSEHPYLMVAMASTSLILISVASYNFFEKPSRLFLRRLLSGNAVGLAISPSVTSAAP